MRVGAVPGALAGSWEPVPHAGLPRSALMQGKSLVLPQLHEPWFADAHERSAPC